MTPDLANILALVAVAATVLLLATDLLTDLNEPKKKDTENP